MAYRRWGKGGETQNAGTVILMESEAKKGHRTYVTFIRYTTGATGHTITLMKPRGETTLSAAATAAQAVVTFTATTLNLYLGGTEAVAGSDHICIQKPNGDWFYSTISSISGSDVTMAANVPTGGFLSGARVLWYGVVSDSAHDDFKVLTVASLNAQEYSAGPEGCLIASDGPDQPIILSSANNGNAGSLVAWGGYFDRC